jgi:hypothetical protein
MIQLDVSIFILLIETLVVFIALFLIWLLRSRKLSIALANAISRVRVLVKKPDARQYLLTEANITRDHVRTLPETEQETGKTLTFRADFLQLEHEIAENTARDIIFWDALGKQVGSLLSAHDMDSGMAGGGQGKTRSKDLAGDVVKAQDLFAEQTKTISFLQRQVKEAVGDPAKAEKLQKQIDRIMGANRELSHCVSTLESEISYLQDKVRTLEKQAGAEPTG